MYVYIHICIYTFIYIHIYLPAYFSVASSLLRKEAVGVKTGRGKMIEVDETHGQLIQAPKDHLSRRAPHSIVW